MTTANAKRLVTDFLDYARRDDAIFARIDSWGSALAAILTGIGGFYNGEKFGLPTLLLGFVVLVFTLLMKRRESGGKELAALAIVAQASADARESEADALAARAETAALRHGRELQGLRDERDESQMRATVLSLRCAEMDQCRHDAEIAKLKAEGDLNRTSNLLHKEKRLSESRRVHRQLMLIAFEGIQNSIATCPLDMPIRNVVEAMLDAAHPVIVEALGCQIGERWTFSIFSREEREAGDVMVRSFARAWSVKEQADRRTWASGEGYTGAAWKRREPVVERDARDPAVANDYFVPAEKLNGADKDLYVSIAAVPIFIAEASGKKRVCGCITVTSDRPGRFLRDQSDPQAQNLELLLALERIVSAQIALRRDRADGAFKLPLN